MGFEVEVEIGSIQFLVNGSITDGVIDYINKVSVWDGEQYNEIEFDSEYFIKVYGDYVLDALSDQEEAERDYYFETKEKQRRLYERLSLLW